MDSKTLTTVLIVIVCFLLFPMIIGAIGSVFGLLGGILGGFFGMIGGIFGAIFGIIGGLFGVIFGFIGWIFGKPFHWGWPGHHVDGGEILAFITVVIVVVLLTRSKATRTGK